MATDVLRSDRLDPLDPTADGETVLSSCIRGWSSLSAPADPTRAHPPRRDPPLEPTDDHA